MEYQTTLNQFDSGFNSFNNNYYLSNSLNDNNYMRANDYQTTLDRWMPSNSGLHYSNRVYGQFSTDGSIHDTFRIDRYDNIYGGHTTVDLGHNNVIHLPWNG
jgi:hypothetical protein